MMITKKALSRRAILRGWETVALPLLDARSRHVGLTHTRPAPYVVYPTGVIYDKCRPRARQQL
ncbi:MAG: hypothetical protein WKF37_08985 [Bryobacteraceae bacterium]